MAIYVLDNHPLYQKAVCNLMKHQHIKLSVIGCSDFKQLQLAIAQNGWPELIVFGFNFTEELGIFKLQKLRHIFPDVALVVLSGLNQKSLKEKCLILGVKEYLSKSVATCEIAAVFSAQILNVYALDKLKTFALTKRQNQILKLIEKGSSNKQIAEVLEVNEKTIKVHLWRLYSSINVKNRAHAVFQAKKYNLLAQANY